MPVNTVTHRTTTTHTTHAPRVVDAIKLASMKSISDYGRTFALNGFPSKMTPNDIVAKLTGIDKADLGKLSDWGKVGNSATAVTAFSKMLKADGKDFASNQDTPAEGKKVAAAYNAVADSVSNYFKAPEFTKLVTVEHSIQEDGDTEYHILMGQKKDGSWMAMTYTNFPF